MTVIGLPIVIGVSTDRLFELDKNGKTVYVEADVVLLQIACLDDDGTETPVELRFPTTTESILELTEVLEQYGHYLEALEMDAEEPEPEQRVEHAKPSGDGEVVLSD